MDLLKRLKGEVLISDGAIGTSLQAIGLPAGAAPEIWNLEQPGKVIELHTDFMKAGADILTTNTFGGNEIKLASFGLLEEFESINSHGVSFARKAAGDKAFVAASIGPTGLLMEPFGELTFERAFEVFYNQAQVLAEAGANIITIETMTEIREFKAAIAAAKAATQLPIFAQMSFDDKGRAVTGTPPEVAAVVAEAMQVPVCGANCGRSLEENLEASAQVRKFFDRFVIAQPNAGVPAVDADGNTIFPAGPEEMADYAEKLHALGINIIGSCCGSTPEHTNTIVRRVKGKNPNDYEIKSGMKISSRTMVTTINKNQTVTLIGEKINPSGRDQLKSELLYSKFTELKHLAVMQVKNKADILDLNIGVGSEEEPAIMARAVKILDNTVKVPYIIDSDSVAVIASGLEAYPGKTFINSVNGKEESYSRLLPLAVKYGAGIIVLTLDDAGIPDRASGRLAIAQKVAKMAIDMGISKADIIIDPIVLPVSSAPSSAKVTLESIRLIKDETDFLVSIGASNISYGLPGRRNLNSAFIAMAIEAGLDAVIAAPTEEIVLQIYAASLLTDKDRGAENYMNFAAGVDMGEGEIEGEDYIEVELTPYTAVLDGEVDAMDKVIDESLAEGVDPKAIIDDKLLPAMKEVGERFDSGKYFLPQVLASADAMKRALTILKAKLGTDDSHSKAKVVVATVEGDIHDIGKNLVKMMLEVNGYDVLDLGKNVPTSEIIKTCTEYDAEILGLSALMTTTRDKMREVLDELRVCKLKVKTMIGGACVDTKFADKIGADAYGKNAVEAVKIADRMIKTSGEL